MKKEIKYLNNDILCKIFNNIICESIYLSIDKQYITFNNFLYKTTINEDYYIHLDTPISEVTLNLTSKDYIFNFLYSNENEPAVNCMFIAISDALTIFFYDVDFNTFESQYNQFYSESINFEKHDRTDFISGISKPIFDLSYTDSNSDLENFIKSDFYNYYEPNLFYYLKYLYKILKDIPSQKIEISLVNTNYRIILKDSFQLTYNSFYENHDFREFNSYYLKCNNLCGQIDIIKNSAYSNLIRNQYIETLNFNQTTVYLDYLGIVIKINNQGHDLYFKILKLKNKVAQLVEYDKCLERENAQIEIDFLKEYGDILDD